MHWGHAISTDLVHWKEEPIAIFPDSLGYIFSGSAVWDAKNTSGLGTSTHPPLVAVFTQHDPAGQNIRKDYQNQSLAFSLDGGSTWKKYQHNPVLRNPGITDFRDPKVMWYDATRQWIMTLAVKDRVHFYSSKDLKNWSKQGEFGANQGAHGGVWECPDLFRLRHGKDWTWVLLVSINPGGPNGGSATQYFLGSFDGKKFNANDTVTRWLDFGPDDYAGVTWSNTGDRQIFMGWMSNWQYARLIPEGSWRNAMTIPRTLSLVQAGDALWVSSIPAPELWKLALDSLSMRDVPAGLHELSESKSRNFHLPCVIRLQMDSLVDLQMDVGNQSGQRLSFGYSGLMKSYFINREHSGSTQFHPAFAAPITAPRLKQSATTELLVVLDQSSLEFFADNGLTVMTALYFPDETPDHFQVSSATGIRKIECTMLREIWSGNH
jgi:fructan beta-fructosidase